ncbi:MAG: CYTH domain-containing protein [Verrucomicrobiales bacterium]|nr:CYTH domain-containing protein [Verrucomicrobiales bacterium]
MAIEIERKFLVEGDFLPHVTSSKRIVQGYLSSHPERSVRVRVSDDDAFLTVKGRGNESGISRFEWEHAIPLAEAEALLDLCEPGIIEKVRHLVPCGQHLYEVDVFEGNNAGLILAEIELSHEEESFPRPDWLGNEVTGDPHYYNTMLAKAPHGERSA